MKKLISVLLSVLIVAIIICPAVAAQDSQADIPKIKITTPNGNGVDLKKTDGYIDAQADISDNSGFSLSDSIVMKVRGNSTAFDSIGKKSYTFKFKKKKELFSMGSGKKWVLISNVLDPTLARNYTAFSIAQELGITYTSNFKVVELWLDDSFRGCYLLMEPVAEGKDRVDIDIESNGGKKDFLVELEKSRDEADKTYIISNGIRFALSEPDEPEEEQVSYIQGVMDDTISTLKNGAAEEIEEKVDVDSFVKFYLLNEFLKPVDFDFSSVFFYYKDGKLYAGPPWDYDLSMGNENIDFSANSASAIATDGIFANKNLCKFLCAKDWFKEKVKQLFAEKYLYFKNIGAAGGFIDSFYETYEPAIERNFASGVWRVSGYYVNVQKKPLGTYKENYDYFVNWCNERVSYLADYFEINPDDYTEEPTTEEPTTEAPSTEAPTTEAPATEAPTEEITSEPVEQPTETQTAETTEQVTESTEVSTQGETETFTETESAFATVETASQAVTESPTAFTEPSEPATEPNETKAPETQPPVNPTQPKTEPKPISGNTDPTEKPAVPSLKQTEIKLKAGKTAAITVLNKGNNSVSYKTTNKKVAIVKNGKAAALKKGSANIIVTVGNTKLIFKVKVTSSPKLSRKSITVKKGKTKTVKIKGKSSFVKNKYKNSKFAKIVSKKSAKKIKIKGLKKGKTTLKITVNGVKLKLKVKVK